MTRMHDVSQEEVSRAWEQVRRAGGGAGYDDQTIQTTQGNLDDCLYKLWNRMSSGSYMAQPVLLVDIPKMGGGKRTLGIPTVTDRVAQAVIKNRLEPVLEKVFHKDSFGYRPNKSAKRFLKAKGVTEDGQEMEREKGTPQGGVISPVLANLYLHEAFDQWMASRFPEIPFERYADDIIVHCVSEKQAYYILNRIRGRLQQFKLELHPDKTKVVYTGTDKRDPKLKDIAKEMEPMIRGWIQYFGHFRKSELYTLALLIDKKLIKWLKRKHKSLNTVRKAWNALHLVKAKVPKLFPHWYMISTSSTRAV